MKSFVSQIIVLVATLVAVHAAHVRYTEKKTVGESDGNFVLPHEWLKVSIKNDSVIRVPVGAAIEINCEAVGSPPPSIKWYHYKTLLLETGFPEQNEIVNIAIGKLKTRVVINCVMPHHQGVYSCSGTAGSKRRTPAALSLIVEETGNLPKVDCERNKPTVPRIVTWAPTLLEFAERDVVLPCSSVGNPAPLTYWINHKNEIIEMETVSPQYKLLDNGDLFISQLSWDDMGTYTCVAENILGKDEVETFLYPVRKTDQDSDA